MTTKTNDVKFADATFNSVTLKTSVFLDSDAVTKSYVDAGLLNAYTLSQKAMMDLVNGAPAQLDTLKEISTALNNDSNLYGTLTGLITNVQTNVDAEKSRAILSETTEVTRAKLSETTNDARALSVEGVLDRKIIAETQRSIAAETTLDLNKANLSSSHFTGLVILDDYLQLGNFWRLKAFADGSRLVFEYRTDLLSPWNPAVPFVRPL